MGLSWSATTPIGGRVFLCIGTATLAPFRTSVLFTVTFRWQLIPQQLTHWLKPAENLAFCLAYAAYDAHMMRYSRIMRLCWHTYAQMHGGGREPRGVA